MSRLKTACGNPTPTKEQSNDGEREPHWYDRDGRSYEEITEEAIEKLKRDIAEARRAMTRTEERNR